MNKLTPKQAHIVYTWMWERQRARWKAEGRKHPDDAPNVAVVRAVLQKVEHEAFMNKLNKPKTGGTGTT